MRFDNAPVRPRMTPLLRKTARPRQLPQFWWGGSRRARSCRCEYPPMRQAIAQKVSDTTGEFELRYRRRYHSPESPHYQEGGANTHRSRSDALTAGGRQPAVRGANTTVRVVTPCAGWTVMPPMS